MGQRHTTHVANAHKEDIYVKIDADRRYVTFKAEGRYLDRKKNCGASREFETMQPPPLASDNALMNFQGNQSTLIESSPINPSWKSSSSFNLLHSDKIGHSRDLLVAQEPKQVQVNAFQKFQSGDSLLQTFQKNKSTCIEIDSPSVSASMQVASYNWQCAGKDGFTRIRSGDYLGFNPDSNRKSVYITILTESGMEVCNCYCLTVDYSIIVDKYGCIQETKYGSIWTDKKGRDHFHT